MAGRSMVPRGHMEETPSYFREKAKQCRRLAAEVVNQDDPIAVALRALAEEFEAKAAAQPAEQAGIAHIGGTHCDCGALIALRSLPGVAAASAASEAILHDGQEFIRIERLRDDVHCA
jgi:hypothetical protein